MAKKAESTFTIRAVDKTQKALARVKRGFKAIGVAAVAATTAAVGSIVAMTAKGMDRVDAMAKAAGRLDLGVGQFQALESAAAKADVSVGDLESAFGRMRREIGEGDKVFAELGLSVDSLLKMNANEQFTAIAKSLSDIENPTIRAAKAQEIFGRSAQKLNNLMRDGGVSIGVNAAMFEDLGIAATDQGAAGVEMANDAISDLKKIGEGVSNTLAEQLAPAILVVAESLMGAGGGGGGLGDAIKNVSRFLVDGLVAAVATAADAWRNLNIFIKSGEVALLSIAKAVSPAFTNLLKNVATGIETVVNSVFEAINTAIRKVNDSFDKLPKWLKKHLNGGEIPEINVKLNLDVSKFNDFDSSLGGALGQAQSELSKQLASPLPSDGIIDGFNERIFDAENRAQELATEKKSFQSKNPVIEEAEIVRDHLKEIEDEIKANTEEFVDSRETTLIDGTQSAFDGLLGLTEQFSGEQSALYKTMFAASKAFATAQSIVSITQGIANAAALPFPSNLAAMGSVVGATAGLIQTIASTALSFEGGGRTGNGPRSGGLDGKGGFMAMLHPQERVIDDYNDRQSGRVTVNVFNQGGGDASVRRRGNEIDVFVRAVEDRLVAGENNGNGRLSKAIRLNNGLQRVAI